MRHTYGLRVLGILLLLLLFGGGQVAAQGVERPTGDQVLAVQDDDVCEVEDADEAEDEGSTPEVEDEGVLCQDIDNDGTFEVGIDEDNDGVLDEAEVTGTADDEDDDDEDDDKDDDGADEDN